MIIILLMAFSLDIELDFNTVLNVCYEGIVLSHITINWLNHKMLLMLFKYIRDCLDNNINVYKVFKSGTQSLNVITEDNMLKFFIVTIESNYSIAMPLRLNLVDNIDRIIAEIKEQNNYL